MFSEGVGVGWIFGTFPPRGRVEGLQRLTLLSMRALAFGARAGSISGRMQSGEAERGAVPSVATALLLESEVFLTGDARQARMAAGKG